MGRDRNGTVSEKEDESERKSGKAREHSDSESESEPEEDTRRSKSRRKARESSESSDAKHVKSSRRKRKSRRRRRHSSSEDDSDPDSESEESGSDSGSESASESGRESESESERRRKRKRRREKDDRRRREKEKKRRRREREEERKKKEKRKKKKKKEKKEKGKKGAVTDLWGKYGIIRETDMWTKRPEFTAWLAEVKQVNLEHLANWEEKQMFKQFMEDHNTATFPSKKYYSLDAYYRHKMEKEMKRGFKKVETERTVFNDEEVRRQEMMRVREKQKEEEVVALKRSMQSGLAQAMKEQAQLREEMAYQYKIGNFEAAAAIQRRLDPDAE